MSPRRGLGQRQVVAVGVGVVVVAIVARDELHARVRGRGYPAARYCRGHWVVRAAAAAVAAGARQWHWHRGETAFATANNFALPGPCPGLCPGLGPCPCLGPCLCACRSRQWQRLQDR